MEANTENIKKSNLINRAMYVIIWLSASLPAFCGYLMDGGEIREWIARVEELKGGAFFSQLSPLDSNLWLLPMVLLCRAGLSLGIAYGIFVLLLQSAATFCAKLLFSRLFGEREQTLFATLFYVTCPYHIYVCFDLGDWGKAVAWTLTPLAAWGMAGIVRKGFGWLDSVVVALAMAGIGYADCRMFLVAAGVLFLGILWYRKFVGFFPLLLGAILYGPGLIRLIVYLFTGGDGSYQLSLQSIAGSGYALGQFFSSYVYAEGRPGLGLGLLGGILLSLWLRFARNVRLPKKADFCVFFAVLFLLMSSWRFPWDVISRIGVPVLRLVSLMETPAVFFGCACMFLSVPAAWGVGEAMKQESKYVRVGAPLLIFAASIAIAVFLCNSLTYIRMPLS